MWDQYGVLGRSKSLILERKGKRKPALLKKAMAEK
jgi:hypothetical protein